MQEWIWVNGRPATEVAVQNRGLTYGDGLFETLRISTRGPVLLEYHLDRLQNGAQRLRIPFDRAAMTQELNAFPGCHHPGIVKLIYTRGVGGRGYSPANFEQPTRILSSHSEPTWPARHYEQGVHLHTCQTRLGRNPLLAGMKHLNRLEQVLARSEWLDADAYQEGLVCDTEGNMVEGVMSNLFFVVDKVVQTPLLANCGVAGVLRRWLLEHFQRLQMTVAEVEKPPCHLQRASEVFTCNSVYGVWPVASLGNLQWVPGAVTRRAQTLFQQHWL